MTRKMKDSGVKWIGEIPEGWKVGRIKSLCVVKDGTHDTPKYVDESNDSFPLITSKNITNGNIDFSKVKFIAYNDFIDINRRSNVQQYDVIMPMIGTIGNPTIVKTKRKFSIKNVALFKCSHNTTLAKLIKYYLESDMITGQFEFLNRGGVQSFVSLRVLQNLICTIIPKSELISRVNYLDTKCTKIDQTIEKQKQVIEKLKEYKQSIITEAVTKGLNPNVKMNDSGVEWIGEIPEHWEIRKMKYEFIIKKNIAGREGYDILSVTQGGIKIKDISNNNGQLAMNYSKYQLVEIGDYIMNHMDLLTGFVDCSKFSGVTSPDYRVFHLINSNRSKEYYKYIFQCCYFNKIFFGLGQGVSGLGRWRLQTDKFVNFIIPIPPDDEQLNISQYIDRKLISIDKAISKKQQLIDKLTQYKKSLIYECVTGKKEVNNCG